MVRGTDTPISFTAPTGSLALIDGPAELRRSVLATLAGRSPLRAGRAQVARLPLPSDSAGVARRVAVVDAGNADDLGGSVHELLAERIALTTPWYATGRRRSAERAILDRAARALNAEGLPRIDGHERLDELPRDSRVAFAAAMAAADSTPVVVLDLGEWTGEGLQRGLRLLDAVLPTTTTAVVTISGPVIAELGSARPVVVASLDRKAVLV